MVGLHNDLSVLANLDTGVLVTLGILVAVQLMFTATALVALWRTPISNLRYLSFWGWAVVIVLVNIFGAVAFFLLGRRAVVVGAVAPRDKAATIVAQLYGDKRS